jgi:hypothetical protein
MVANRDCRFAAVFAASGRFFVIFHIMVNQYNLPLIIAACLSALASLLHVCIVVGGPPWYRFFGAGERMASAAAAGRAYPTVITLGIALVLGIWAAYALAGAGVISPLPLLKVALSIITAIYLLRGIAIFPLLAFALPKETPFLLWSSLICIAFGAVHLLGVTQVWAAL